jgi:hypothetical protein
MDIISTSLANKAISGLKTKADISGTSVTIPRGTTAERPTLGASENAIRYNTTESALEEWNGTIWRSISVDISAVSLKGTDTEANIMALTGMSSEDLWIASDTLDGWVYDGATWINIGPLQGPTGTQGIQGPKGDIGNSISSVTRTSGDGSAGTVDTYTITYTDGGNSTFDVTNGNDGDTINSITRTDGSGNAGEIDTYTMWKGPGDTNPAGTFEVRNGTNGAGTVASIIGGSNIIVDNADPNNPIVSVNTSSSDTYTNKTIDDYTNIVKANAVHSRVKNQSGVTMTKGTVVTYSGYSDSEDAIKVVKADNTTGVAIGILNDDILADEFGMMISTGIIDGLDTSTYTNGTILYTDATGGLTDVEPTTGFSQPIAYVLKSNENIGVLQVLAAYPKQDADDVRVEANGSLSAGTVQSAIESIITNMETLSSGTITPTLSTFIVSQTEGSSTEVAIADYNAAFTYVVESLDEAVATVTRVDDVVTITGSDVTENSNTIVRVNATAPGMSTSDWFVIAVTTIFVPSEADDAIVNADLSANGALTGFDSSTGGITATTDNAVYKENIQEQGVGENDWIRFSNSTVTYEPKEITVDAETTETLLVSFDEITTGNNLLVYNSTDGIVERTAGSVTTTGGSIVSSIDPFGDGSLLAKYEFEDVADGQTFTTVSDTTGSYSGTATNVVSGAGKFGQGVVFNGTAYTKTIGLPALTVFEISLRFKTSDVTTGSLAEIGSSSISISMSRLFFHDGQLRLSQNDGGGGAIYVSVAGLDDNQWHTVSGTITANGAMFLIVDNTLSVSGTSTADFISTSELTLGVNDNHSNGRRQYFVGSIDQVEIYNRALTPTERTTLYTQSATKYQAPIDATTVPATKAYHQDTPEMYIDVADAAGDIDIDANGTQLSAVSDTYDGTKFTAVYADHNEQGRAVQRKVVANEGTQVYDGMSTETVKLGE